MFAGSRAIIWRRCANNWYALFAIQHFISCCCWLPLAGCPDFLINRNIATLAPMAILFTNIQTLVNVREDHYLLRGKELAKLPCLDNAYLIVDGDLIADYGKMSELKYNPSDFQFCYDMTGQCILPSWCDSHTHLVFAGSRENEFVDKIKGLSYADIAARGGGILNSAKTLNNTSEDELFNQSYRRLQNIIKLGTGAIEIKSGYGLTVDGELKMLRVIRRLKNASRISIKSTFFGFNP